MTTLVILALAAQRLVLFDFEREHDLRMWKTNGEKVQMLLVDEHVTSGRRALKLVVGEGEEWPSMYTERIPHDWTGYDVLRADVYNPQDRATPFMVRIDDFESRDNKSWYSKLLTLAPGRNLVEVRLSDLPTIDEKREIRLDAVKSLHYSLTLEAPVGRTMYLDNVRLEKTDRRDVSRRRGPTPLARGAAVITLTTGRKFIGKVLEADDRKVRVRTAFASLELKRSQIKSIDGPGGAPVTRARENVDFFASVPVNGGEAREMQERNLKFAGGFHKEGEVSGRVVRGLRCGEKFVLVLDVGGQELAFCVPFRAVGEHPRRSIYDPGAVRGVKRLRPGQEAEVHWHNRGDGWLWMEAPEGEVELPDGVEEILEGLGGRDWRNSIGRLASQVDPREAALVLSDIVDSNRGANVALDALLQVLQRMPAGEVPEEVATSLVFGLFHPYDNGIRVKCARAFGVLGLREAESALRDCVAVRSTPRDGAAFEKHKRELHQAVAEALKRVKTTRGPRERATAAIVLFKADFEDRDSTRWTMGKIVRGKRGFVIEGVMDEGRLRVRTNPQYVGFKAGKGLTVRFRYLVSGSGEKVTMLLCGEEMMVEAAVPVRVRGRWQAAELGWTDFRGVHGRDKPTEMQVGLLNWFLTGATGESRFFMDDIEITGPRKREEGAVFSDRSVRGFVPVRKDGETWFWISDHETTNAEYKRFVDATGHSPPDKGNFGTAVWKGSSCPAGLAEYPVVCVSWNDAAAYCRWLTRTERAAGRLGANEEYRLPTVAEWKYAAYGPRRLKYPWGNDWDEKKLNGWSSGDRPSSQKPVAGLVSTRSIPDGRSWCGCYHMWGNVWEWTMDRSTRDGRPSRVLLGGAWYDKIGPNSPARHNRTVDDRRNDMGFRPVRASAEAPESSAMTHKLIDTFEAINWRSTKENCKIALELSSRFRKNGSRSLRFYKAEKVIHDGKISRPVRLPRGAKGLRFWVMKGGKEAPTLGIALSGGGTHFWSGSADKDLNDALQDLPKGAWKQVEVYFDPETMSSWPHGRELDLTRIDTLVIRVGDNKTRKDFGRVLYIDDMELIISGVAAGRR